MNFKERSYEKELLDKEHIPFEDIRRNMQELNRVNKLLGGHNISISGLKNLLGNKKQVLICEIGCGGGDNIVALNKWCIKNHVSAEFIGIDIKPECITFAESVVQHPVEWIVSDYRLVSFERVPDIIFSSLFCHHFTYDELIFQVQWMKENSSLGFFINDLHRNQLAYYSIKILTQIFSSSYLVKNDAPISVARGFKREEWSNILKSGHIEPAVIKWKWAFRYLVIYKHG